MKKLVLALAALSLLAVTLPAKAGQNCTTTCNNVGNQRVCNTHCW